MAICLLLIHMLKVLVFLINPALRQLPEPFVSAFWRSYMCSPCKALNVPLV